MSKLFKRALKSSLKGGSHVQFLPTFVRGSYLSPYHSFSSLLLSGVRVGFPATLKIGKKRFT